MDGWFENWELWRSPMLLRRASNDNSLAPLVWQPSIQEEEKPREKLEGSDGKFLC